MILIHLNLLSKALIETCVRFHMHILAQTKNTQHMQKIGHIKTNSDLLFFPLKSIMQYFLRNSLLTDPQMINISFMKYFITLFFKNNCKQFQRWPSFYYMVFISHKSSNYFSVHNQMSKCLNISIQIQFRGFSKLFSCLQTRSLVFHTLYFLKQIV